MSDPRTKIRSLLVKANHAGTPEHEAALSRQVAAKLCTKYGLDLEALEREAREPVRDTFLGGYTRPGMAFCRRCGAAAAVLSGMCVACMMDAMFTQTGAPRSAPRNPPGTGPRPTGATTSTGKARLNHSGCDHDATPAARAKCRRERARQGL